MVMPFTTPEASISPRVSREAHGIAGRTSPPPVGASSTTKDAYCPRCDSRLVIGYEEPQCLSCGYVDYTYTPQSAPQNRASVLSA